MGCTSSCSGSSSPKQCSSARALLHTELTEQDLPRIETESKLQHISDRENAEDHILGHNPSDHPQTCTLFISKSQTAIQDRRKRLCVNQQHGRSRKIYSSCSTIFLDDNTVSRPNLKFTIKCVSLAIYYHIKNRDQKSHSLLDIFDEKLHPLSKGELPEDYDKQNPETRQIYHFIQTLFNSARLSPECAIVTLVYLERLLSYAEITVCPRSWKRMVLGAILLASKVWDDQAVWNVDYCNILKHVTIQDMNELEREFLELLQFNINVPSSIYAKYYFDLRSLAEANNFTSPTLALSRDRALQLEAMSQLYDEYKNIKKILHKRSTSTDNLCVATWVPAILS